MEPTDVRPAGGGIATLPNLLSMLRLLSVPVFVWLFVTGREEVAFVIYAVSAWTDFFDGYLARRMGSISELGKLLDPLADRVFIIALAVALVLEDVLPWWLAVAVIARDVLVLSAFPALERRKIQRIQVNFTGKSATAALLTGLTLLALSETDWSFVDYADEAGMALTVLGAILYWVAGGMYAAEAFKRLKGPA